MSLESSIAALTAQAGLLLDLPQQIQTAALQRQAEITNTYNDRLARLETTFYVNHLTGLDTNAGTAAGVPLKTIQRALDLGSGLVDHSQNRTVAARAMAEKKTVGQRS